MPNMLAHLGVGTVATRCFDRTADTKWIYLGCLIPDVPWIAQRIVRAMPIAVDPYALKLYTTAQATLAGCLILSAALALISASPRKVFLILAGNSALHLLLDGCQTKWGGGVHLLAPWSWDPLNLCLFWPESLVTAALTVFGLIYCLQDLVRRRCRTIDLTFGSAGRLGGCLALLLAYLVVPHFMTSGAFQANSHFVRTLKDVSSRSGQHLELDRARFRSGPAGMFVTTFGREDLPVDLTTERTAGTISIRGTFVDQQTVDVDAFHEHLPILRDATSVVGIGLVLYSWSVYLATASVGLGAETVRPTT